MIARFRNSGSLRAYGALLCVYLAWGTTFAAIHVGLQSITPLTLGFQRFFLVGLILLGYCLLVGESWPSAFTWRRNTITGFFLFISGNALSIWTLNYLPTGLAAILFAINPFWMVGLSFFIPPKETVTPAVLIGMLLGFLGLVVTLVPQWSMPEAHQISSKFMLSLISLLIVGLSWSYGSIYFRKVQDTSSLLMSVALQNLTAGLMLFVLALIYGDNPFDLGTQQSQLSLLYLILVGSFVGQSCYLYSIEKLPVAVSSTYSYVNPVVTMLVGWLILHEVLTWHMIVGMIMILLGVSLVQHQSLARKKKEQLQLKQPLEHGGTIYGHRTVACDSTHTIGR